MCLYQPATDCSHFILVYTNDVVLAIQRSQMLICVLSAEYLSNTDAVFILESGLQVGKNKKIKKKKKNPVNSDELMEHSVRS